MTRFIDEYLLYLLARSSSKASAAFHAQLAELGVPVTTWRVLASLYPAATVGISALAQSCMTKQSTMTRKIDRMEQDGLVLRQPSTSDRRRVRVHLTDRGRRLAKDLTDRAKAHEAHLLGATDPQEISALKATLTKLTQD